MFLRTIRQVWWSIQTRNAISALVYCHRFLKGAGHSTPNLMQNQRTLCSGCFWDELGNFKLFPIFLNSLLASDKIWLFNSYFRKSPHKVFLLWLSSSYACFAWCFVLPSLHHPQVFQFSLWMSNSPAHGPTHFVLFVISEVKFSLPLRI